MGLRQPTLEQLRATAALLAIPLKDAGAVGPWILNESQERVAADLCAGRSIVVLKLRQEGITSVCLLWLLLLAVLNPGLHFAIVLQDSTKAKEKLEVVRSWLAQLGMGGSLEVQQAQKLRLPGGSEIHALSARGGEAEGEETAANRSGSYAAALLSEAGYYSNDKALPAIKAAVGRGPIVVESTASGPEGFFASLVKGESTFKVVFLGVEQSARCRLEPEAITDEEWTRLQAEHGFTSREHAAWWLRELRDVGGDVLSMLREYPVRPEDPFRLSESMWVQARPSTLAPASTTAEGIEIYAPRHREAPHAARYVLSVDVAEGVGGDWSVAVVLDRTSLDVCALWVSNTDETDVLAMRMAEMHRLYVPDTSLVEKNGVGVAAVKEARRLHVNVSEVTATEASKYAELLAAKRYLESREAVPALFVTEAASLRVKVGRMGRYQWIGRKDGLIALGQALEWARLNPWAPPRPLRQDNYWDMVKMAEMESGSDYYGRGH